MKRREFIKLLGVTPAAAASSKALAMIPEVEPKILLLDKKIEVVKEIPDVDFIIQHVRRITYIQNNYIQFNYSAIEESPTLYNFLTNDIQINVRVEYYIDNESGEGFHHGTGYDYMIPQLRPATFSFLLKDDNSGRYPQLTEINGRKFVAIKHEVQMAPDSFTTVTIEGVEVE